MMSSFCSRSGLMGTRMHPRALVYSNTTWGVALPAGWVQENIK
ncbi:unknown [Clostridium clostridioforme CAG:132]|uniref:Uncharacterized protein n=1 Tax=[Clostridium] clostridioforme CAG:132 TaxID=1263065 RepID=R6JWG3_9FIRM|nr:unknown [[Clostridium] clostridioforme CAG:132]